MKLSPLKQLLIATGVAIAVGLFFVSTAKKPTTQPVPGVAKTREVVGTVVGGPQIVSGNPLIGYAVRIEETKTWGALHADGCPPQLESGSHVVMYQGKKRVGILGSNWYIFLRYAQ